MACRLLVAFNVNAVSSVRNNLFPIIRFTRINDRVIRAKHMFSLCNTVRFLNPTEGKYRQRRKQSVSIVDIEVGINGCSKFDRVGLYSKFCTRFYCKTT